MKTNKLRNSQMILSFILLILLTAIVYRASIIYDEHEGTDNHYHGFVIK